MDVVAADQRAHRPFPPSLSFSRARPLDDWGAGCRGAGSGKPTGRYSRPSPSPSCYAALVDGCGFALGAPRLALLGNLVLSDIRGTRAGAGLGREYLPPSCWCPRAAESGVCGRGSFPALAYGGDVHLSSDLRLYPARTVDWAESGVVVRWRASRGVGGGVDILPWQWVSLGFHSPWRNGV
jgi:hypothetical protein